MDGNDTRDLREIVTDIEFMEPSDRDELAELLGRRAGRDPDDAGLRRADIRDLSADGRYEIGFHTAPTTTSRSSTTRRSQTS